jgi:hypothetical protein
MLYVVAWLMLDAGRVLAGFTCCWARVAGMGLRELSVVEQRFHAVMEVRAGSSKTEVAARYGGVSADDARVDGVV